MTQFNPTPPRSPGDADHDVYQVQRPQDPMPDSGIHDLVMPEIVPEDDDEEVKRKGEPARDRFQFTLRDMLWLTTGVAVWLSAMSIIHWSWSIAAGLAGVAALVSLIVLGVHEPDNPNVRFAWWCIMIVYALTSLAAMVAGR